jgi:hypothetical protein
MSTEMQIKLATSWWGRATIHLVMIQIDGKWGKHMKGVCREVFMHNTRQSAILRS